MPQFWKTTNKTHHNSTLQLFSTICAFSQLSDRTRAQSICEQRTPRSASAALILSVSSAFHPRILHAVSNISAGDSECANQTARIQSGRICLKHTSLHEVPALTLKALIPTTKVVFFYILVLLFKENKAWHFMWIVCLADDSHEMPSLIFSEKP